MGAWAGLGAGMQGPVAKAVKLPKSDPKAFCISKGVATVLHCIKACRTKTFPSETGCIETEHPETGYVLGQGTPHSFFQVFPTLTALDWFDCNIGLNVI